MMRLDRQSVVDGFDSWLEREHARLHGPGDSVMSDLVAVRQRAALDVTNMDNHPYWKTRQHLDRLRHRVGTLEDVDFAPEMVGRAVSDSLKLVAGMQVKRLVASSKDQADFADQLRRGDMSIADVVSAQGDVLFTPVTDDVMLEVAVLDVLTGASLMIINDRAQEGSDWGHDYTKMTQAARAGESASLRGAIAVVNYIAPHVGGFEAVALRAPAADAADSPLEYPFRSAQV